MTSTTPYTTTVELLSSHATLHETFKTGVTKSLAWRKWQLKQCWWLLHENTDAMVEALKRDMNRDAFEAQSAELYSMKVKVLEAIEKLEEWAKPVRPKGNGFIFGTLGKAHVRKEPLGVALIIGAWNFPFLCTFEPLFGAIAAGNCVLLKPSEVAAHSATLMVSLVNKYLDPNSIRIVTGGASETTKILELKYNCILYTGSTKVGRIVAAAAAKHLTPCILELGGQAPAIVTKSADVSLAAKRIAFTKFMNAGQICLATNHVFVDPAVYDEFVRKLVEWFKVYFEKGERTQYTAIVNERNWDRLDSMLSKTSGKVVRGGRRDREKLWIDPAVVVDVDVDDSLMEEEIFGPILPVIKADYKEAIRLTNELSSHPLGLYIFGTDQVVINEILNNTNSGGVTINDCMMHNGVPNLPFGGTGESGYGYYHGEAGILAFSHQRAVVAPPTWLDKLMSFRFPPYEMADLAKMRTPTTVSFKKGESIKDQKIVSGKGALKRKAFVGAFVVALSGALWKYIL